MWCGNLWTFLFLTIAQHSPIDIYECILLFPKILAVGIWWGWPYHSLGLKPCLASFVIRSSIHLEVGAMVV
jgi:hypothetical protein